MPAWQGTTTFHDDHHKHFHCNFGQHVLWFDHLFGTMRSVSTAGCATKTIIATTAGITNLDRFRSEFDGTDVRSDLVARIPEASTDASDGRASGCFESERSINRISESGVSGASLRRSSGGTCRMACTAARRLSPIS